MNAAWSLSRAKGVCTRKAPSVGLQRHGKRVVHRGPSALRAASDDDIEVSRGGLPLVLPFLSSPPRVFSRGVGAPKQTEQETVFARTTHSHSPPFAPPLFFIFFSFSFAPLRFRK